MCARIVEAGNIGDRSLMRNVEALGLFTVRRPYRAAQNPVAIDFTCRLHLFANVVDFENCALRLLGENDTADLALPLYQPGACQLCHDLVHGHARTAVLQGQLLFRCDLEAGLPTASQDILLDIEKYSLMKRKRRLGDGVGSNIRVDHASMLAPRSRYVSRNCSRRGWRGLAKISAGGPENNSLP
ncbi:hypothetical protein D3C80_1217700 [compost metagenome]